MTPSSERSGPVREFFRALGPAIIVASVVVGPGSILSNSKVGAAFGFRMVWVVLLAAGLMIGTVALAGRLGVVFERSLCAELAARVGRPFAVLVGLTVFFIIGLFQFGNNLGVLAAIGPWVGPATAESEGTFPWLSATNLTLLLINSLVLAFLFGMRRLYGAVEWLMKLLVGLMILGFVGNLVYLLLFRDGALPTVPAASAVAGGSPGSGMGVAVFALLGTTYSVAGAFYQAYLVREKGWGLGDVRRGLVDSTVGIAVLAGISLTIMATAALSFFGTGVELRSVADVARQLEPLFGGASVMLFCLGLLAASLSSFLVNAIVGGTLLADGLGWDARIDGRATKGLAAVVLVLGMVVAIAVPPAERVRVVVLAQAITVVGLPLLAIALLYLATRPDLVGDRKIPAWMRWTAALGSITVLVSALRLGGALLAKLGD